MPEDETAIKGREQSLEIAVNHYVNENPVKGPYPKQYRQLIVAMGCFWGAERMFWEQEGVFSTSAGYIGGSTKNPTYEEVCSGKTGHAESVLIVYDPAIIPLNKLLAIFWEGHDPTQYMRQGNDIGTQYRSVIFFPDEADLELINKTKRLFQEQLARSGYGRIVTEIMPFEAFYFAENYHQQYLAKNPSGYCGLGGTGVSLK
jgi:peptide-methionine (S)-S-oxide reductase